MEIKEFFLESVLIHLNQSEITGSYSMANKRKKSSSFKQNSRLFTFNYYYINYRCVKIGKRFPLFLFGDQKLVLSCLTRPGIDRNTIYCRLDRLPCRRMIEFGFESATICTMTMHFLRTRSRRLS